MADPNRCV